MSTENSSYFSEKTGEIANQGLETQGIEAKINVWVLWKQSKRKEVLNSTSSI
jgi:hypothetical protein